MSVFSPRIRVPAGARPHAQRMLLRALCAGFAVSAASAEPIGQLTAVEGQVERRSSNQAGWQAAALDHRLYLGDWIRTQRSSRAKILLQDDSVLSVDEETELGLDQSVIGAAGGAPHPVIEQVSGQVLTAVGETFGGQTRLEVHTPTAVLGIKGTIFEVRVREETLACVYRGAVSIRNANPAVKGELEVPEGWCREVREGKPPGPPQAPPRDFRSTGPGPGSDAVLPQIEALLFRGEGSGVATGSAGDLGGGRGTGRGDLFDWIADVPPVAAAGEQETEPAAEIEFEAPYEDPRDTDSAAIVEPISVGGGEAPPEN